MMFMEGQPMTDQIQAILTMWCDGLIDTVEATQHLDGIQVRGGFEPGKFTGYDYANQTWIEFAA